MAAKGVSVRKNLSRLHSRSSASVDKLEQAVDL